MSNQDTVEETKQQIRALVNEIASLSKSGMPAEEYYPQLLQRIIAALAAPGGAIWLFDQERDLRITYQINAAEAVLEEGEDGQRHKRLIRRIAANGQGLLVPPYSGTTDAEGEGNPTRFLLVVAPLRGESQVEGLIEVFQRPDSQPRTQQGYLKFLLQMAEVVSEWLKGHQLKALGTRQVLWQQADTFARSAHESLDLRQTCYILANEGRRLIGCDRVSVAIKRGRNCKVEAISGQDSIENRSNIVAALNKLATRVCAAGEPLWHDGKTEDLPPQIEEAVEEYVDQSFGRSIAVLPLRKPKLIGPGMGGATGQIERDDAHRGEVIGALIVEQIEGHLPADVLRSRTDLVYEHGTRAVANSLAHSSLFLMPVWRTLGKATWLIKGNTLWKTVAASIAVVLVSLFLAFFPIDFDLEGQGSLKPDVKVNVFAKQDGEVEEVLVKHGAKVEKDQVLVKLRNRENEVELQKTIGEMNVTEAALRKIRLQLSSNSNLERPDVSRISGEQLEHENKLKHLALTLALLQEKERNLEVRSPIDGEVVTWEVEQALRARPVATGQVLMELADSNQPWHLEVLLPEKRMRHLDQALKDANGKPLDVEFILATDPDTTLKGQLIEVERRAEHDAEEGAVVRLRVRSDDLKGDFLQSGARVTADIKCGRAPAGYVWFYQVYEWILTMIF